MIENVIEENVREEASVLELRRLQRELKIKELEAYFEAHPEVQFSEAPELRILYAIYLALKGDLALAGTLLSGIKEEELQDGETLADCGLLYLLLRQVDSAEVYLKRALELNPALFIAHARLSSLYFLKNRLEEAERHLRRALEIEPERPELLYNLSTLCLRQGRLEEAWELIERALKKAPHRREFWAKKAEIYQKLERMEEFLEELYERLSENPSEKDSYLILAQVLYSSGREEEALAILESALEKFDEDGEVKSAFIEVALRSEAYHRLGSRLKAWVEEKPEDEDLRFLLNEARVSAGFLEAAEKDLEEMPSELKRDPRFKIIKAKILHERNRTAEAVELLEEVVSLYEGHVGARFELSHYLLSLGRREEARRHLEILAEISPRARLQLMRYPDYSLEKRELEELEKIARDSVISLQERIQIGFLLAELYERKGDYEASFNWVLWANELTRSLTRYDWRNHRRYVQRIARAFDEETFQRLRGKGHPSERPIFIVGMPRSGTTLVEQILASHSLVYGAGELSWIPRITALFPQTNGGYPYPEGIRYMDERHLKSAGEYYLEKLKLYQEKAPRVTDKLPHNFDHLGLIHLIFPRAKIIHVLRDPRDVAVSNFYQNFAALRGLMGFANDLKDIGHMLNDYFYIMEHWYRHLPAGTIYQLRYEELVKNPEEQIRKLLEFCELPWEDSVLEFYNTKRPVKTASLHQVREDLYQDSVAKWKRYEAFLTPLFRILEEGFIPLSD